ncbi:unnamed protein product [Effrenium voratum]|uniref:Uncharacterized protein n=1 Tax=Effrenium voratum TaxID=2562239 RepID=A0AA36JJN7_9DINO|nr:unnamed protein product [Effrenium voratum]
MEEEDLPTKARESVLAVDHPNRLSPELWDSICRDSQRFLGQFCPAEYQGAHGRQFLTTAEVQTCICLFAWARHQGRSLGFGTCPCLPYSTPAGFNGINRAGGPLLCPCKK